MPWAVTIKITDCASNSPLPGAWASDGAYGNYTANSYGEIVTYVHDPWESLRIFVGNGCYNTREFWLNRGEHEGQTVTICLNRSPDCPPPSDRPICFIVSATTGSPESAENMRLNMMRDRMMKSTQIGGALLEAIYADYYSFSPAIARELDADLALRDGVLKLIVRPLIAWYGLVESLVLDSRDERAAERGATAVREACAAARRPARDVLATLQRIRYGEGLEPGVDRVLSYIASRWPDEEALPFAGWAIIDPLTRAWHCAADGVDPRMSAGAWLLSAPLEDLPTPPAEEDLGAELSLLARGPFADPLLRTAIGARLGAAWPELTHELRRHGFLDMARD